MWRLIRSGLIRGTSLFASSSIHTSGGRFCIFYGWLVADEAGTPTPSARRIAACRPALLVAPAYITNPRRPNLSAQVMALLHAAGVAVLAYVDVNYGCQPLPAVLNEATEAMYLGAAGILFDQSEHRWRAAAAAYYRPLAKAVRGGGGLVGLNPGVASVDEAFMDVADLLMLEHSWPAFPMASPWHRNYDPMRFMGISSNEPGAQALLGHRVNMHTARQDAQRAWDAGVGWHCATDRFTELPPWNC
jgi:hypothetical protein